MGYKATIRAMEAPNGGSSATRKNVSATPADVTQNSVADMGFHDLLASVQKMREELKSRIAEFNQPANDTILQTNPSP